MSSDASQILVALSHLRRRCILRVLEGQEDPVAPIPLAHGMATPISEIAYHLGILVKAGVLEVEGTEGERGAVRRLYQLTPDGRAEWVRDVLEASRESDDGFCA
jgi:predicted transcriptional regulator